VKAKAKKARRRANDAHGACEAIRTGRPLSRARGAGCWVDGSLRWRGDGGCAAMAHHDDACNRTACRGPAILIRGAPKPSRVKAPATPTKSGDNVGNEPTSGTVEVSDELPKACLFFGLLGLDTKAGQQKPRKERHQSAGNLNPKIRALHE